MNSSIAIDSNLLTYFIESITPRYDPVTDNTKIANDRITMLRLYIYADCSFYILPSVENEYLKITKDSWKEAHQRIHGILLLDVNPAPDIEMVRIRKNYYSIFHPKGEKDCQILAEAEISGKNVLLTRDHDFYNKLHTKTKTIKLMKPIELWRSQNIPKGANPKNRPDSASPLYRKNWWKW